MSEQLKTPVRWYFWFALSGPQGSRWDNFVKNKIPNSTCDVFQVLGVFIVMLYKLLQHTVYDVAKWFVPLVFNIAHSYALLTMNYAGPHSMGKTTSLWCVYGMCMCVYVVLPVWKHWDSMDTNILN